MEPSVQKIFRSDGQDNGNRCFNNTVKQNRAEIYNVRSSRFSCSRISWYVCFELIRIHNDFSEIKLLNTNIVCTPMYGYLNIMYTSMQGVFFLIIAIQLV